MIVLSFSETLSFFFVVFYPKFTIYVCSMSYDSNNLCIHYQVKVMLRVFAAPSEVSDSGTILKVDSRRKQVTLFDATGSGSTSRHASLAMPRVFPVDAAFPHDASQVPKLKRYNIDVNTLLNDSY